MGYVGVSLAFMVAYFAAAGHGLAQSIIFVASNLAAVVAILVGVRLNRPERPGAWYLLAAGQAVYLVGNVFWYVVAAAVGRTSSFASFDAWVFLVSYLLSAIALLRLIRARRAGGDWSALLDALIVTIAFTSVEFVFVIAPEMATSDLTWYGRLLAGVYPFMDMVLLMLVSRLLFGARGAGGALVPLAAWAVALLAADTFYGIEQVRGTFHDGSWLFYGYLASFLFVGVAALHPAMRDVAARREVLGTGGWVRLVALGVCALVVPALVVDLVSHGERAEPIVLACASAVMFIVLMLRVGDLVAKIIAVGRREQRRLQQFLEAIPVGVDVRDAHTGEPAYVNGVAISLLGYDPGRVASPDGLPNLYATGTDEPFPPERLPLAAARLGNVASVDDVEVDVHTRRRHLRVVGTPIRDGNQIRYVLTSFVDITAERRMAEELRQLAVIDELTGVNNRRGFLLAARTEVARAEGARRPTMLLFVDLDGLKAINDSHGHGAGDHALRSAATLLRAASHHSDVIGRVGGDEFCVLLGDGSTPTDAERWVRRLGERVVAYNGSTLQPYRLAFTVGQAVVDGHAPATVEQLIARADAAMYQSRAQNGGQDHGGPVRTMAWDAEHVDVQAARRAARRAGGGP